MIPFFIDRMQEEHITLASKLNRLNSFIETEAFEEQEKEYKKLCKKQAKAMQEYLSCLENRIAYLVKSNK